MKRTKAEWRRALLTARAAIPEVARCKGSAAIMAHVRRLPCFEEARSILGYVALGAEADPASLLASMVDSGRAVFVPPSIDFDAEPRWVSWNDHSRGDVVRGLSARCLAFPVIAIVPGVGFDDRGMRLGRGSGFYDRALTQLRQAGNVHAVGLAFECQIVADLPSDAWDQRVDIVVSDTRVLMATTKVASRDEAGA